MVGVRSEGANFELTQTVIARVSNPAEHDVTKWNVDYRTILRHKQYFPAGAAVIDGDHLYIMGWKQPNEDHRFGRQFLSRIALDDLNKFKVDLSARLQVYTKADEWGLMKDRKKNSEARPKIIMKGTQATEMGQQKLPNECGWLVTLSEAFDAASFAPSNRISMRTSSSLEGPWSEERLIGLTPETDPLSASGSDPSTVCYAAKTHEELSPRNRLLYTYICNLFGPANPFELWERMDLYVPRAVSIDFPTPGNEKDIAANCPWLVNS